MNGPLEQARGLLHAGNIEQGWARLTEAAEATPDDDTIYFLMGCVLYGSDNAPAMFARALELTDVAPGYILFDRLARSVLPDQTMTGSDLQSLLTEIEDVLENHVIEPFSHGILVQFTLAAGRKDLALKSYRLALAGIGDMVIQDGFSALLDEDEDLLWEELCHRLRAAVHAPGFRDADFRLWGEFATVANPGRKTALRHIMVMEYMTRRGAERESPTAAQGHGLFRMPPMPARSLCIVPLSARAMERTPNIILYGDE